MTETERLTCNVLRLFLGCSGTKCVKVKGDPGLKFMDFKTDHPEWPPRFWKFVLKFDNGKELVFTDMRQLARIRLVEVDPQSAEEAKVMHKMTAEGDAEPNQVRLSLISKPPLSDLGFDPLLNMPELDVFGELVRKRKMPIKALLLDQSFSAGVGNWVADEVLYQARIHPAQPTHTLDEDQLKILYDRIIYVIQKAVEANADDDLYPRDWLFHYRWDKAKKKMKHQLPSGQTILFETVAGRTSAIVPDFQKLSGEALKIIQERKSPSRNRKATSNFTERKSTKKGASKRTPGARNKRGKRRSPDDCDETDDNDSENEVEDEEEEEYADEALAKEKPKRVRTSKGTNSGKSGPGVKQRVAANRQGESNVKDDDEEQHGKKSESAKGSGRKPKTNSETAVKSLSDILPADENSGRRRSVRLMAMRLG
ncbi:hypothetical protein HK102_002039 [Quaeritorhiza haematococci]|nr:hypothetical protein HK102_002039 [Quaeritorhiza haematococci]